jgi:type IV pilus assembly protein PilW
MKPLTYFRKEIGVTLVELLVGLSVGFIVVGGIIALYTNTAGSSASTIKGAVLNQEMNSILQLVSNDIRRAGYWLDTNTSATTDSNPFTNPAYEYNLTIGTWDSDSSGSDEATSTCITFAYDINQNSKVGIGSLTPTGSRVYTDGSAIEEQVNLEIIGFRYNTTDKNMEMRTGGSAGQAFNCTAGIWTKLNDEDVIAINSFSINTANTTCINTTTAATPNDWTTINSVGTTTTFCSEPNNANRVPSTGTTDVTVIATDSVAEVRQINITLTGELRTDSSVTKTLTRAIRVRNNRAITGLTL